MIQTNIHRTNEKEYVCNDCVNEQEIATLLVFTILTVWKMRLSSRTCDNLLINVEYGKFYQRMVCTKVNSIKLTRYFTLVSSIMWREAIYRCVFLHMLKTYRKHQISTRAEANGLQVYYQSWEKTLCQSWTNQLYSQIIHHNSIMMETHRKTIPS